MSGFRASGLSLGVWGFFFRDAVVRHERKIIGSRGSSINTGRSNSRGGGAGGGGGSSRTLAERS